MKCEETELLLTDLLAGELAAESAVALDAHLAGCSACREQAVQALRLDRALAERSAQSRLSDTEAAILAALARPRRSSWPTWIRSGVAAAVLLGIGLTVFEMVYVANRSARVPTIATVEEVHGEVHVAGVAAVAGQPLRLGDGIQTIGEDSVAAIRFSDQTQVVLGPNSTIQELTDDAETGKRVVLTEGYLRAAVAKQPPGRPMVLWTPHAQVVVRGTTLSLVNSPEATRVDLEEGKVEVTRRSDGEMVEVAAGSYSIVRPAPESIAARPLPPLVTEPRRRLVEGSGRVLCLAFTPDGKTLATGGLNSMISEWSLTDEDQPPHQWLGHPKDEIRALAYSPDGRILASGGDNGSTTKFWNRADGRPVAVLKGHRSWIEGLAFAPVGSTFIVAGAHGQDSAKVRVWDLDTFRIRMTLQAHAGGVWGVALSADAQLLVSGGRDGTVKLWGLATGQLLHTLEGHGGEVLCVALSPDGRTIASGSRDKTVKLWDVATGQETMTLLGHGHDVRTVAFTRDGQSLLSGSMDGTARLWDLTDGQERTKFRAGGGIWTLAQSTDGKTLAVGGNSKNVLLFDLP